MWQRILQTAPVTGAVLIVAAMAQMSSGLAEVLQVDFLSIANGQWWRIWTGHATHFGNSHFVWDALMFTVLGATCERGRSKNYAAVLFAMAACVTAAIGLGCPGIETYRGLSGIDTGLFAWFVIDQAKAALSAHDRPTALLWSLPLVALMGKLMFEWTTGMTLFVDSSTFRPLVESHLSGAAMGAVAALCLAVTPRVIDEPGLTRSWH